MPIVEIKRPKIPDIKPFRIERLETPAMIVRPKIESQKYSGLLNFIVSSANRGEKK